MMCLVSILAVTELDAAAEELSNNSIFSVHNVVLKTKPSMPFTKVSILMNLQIGLILGSFFLKCSFFFLTRYRKTKDSG